MCAILNMQATDDLGVYLGVPTINGRTCKDDYQYIVDKINSKLSRWKANTLSIAGRNVLAQASLCSVRLLNADHEAPTFNMR